MNFIFQLNVISDDYKVIMQILEKNMTEGQHEIKKNHPPKPVVKPEASKGNIFFFQKLNIIIL